MKNNKDKLKSDDLVFPPIKVPIQSSPHAYKDYDVVQSISLESLRVKIRGYLATGWEIVGGAIYCPKMGAWYQTIVYK